MASHPTTSHGFNHMRNKSKYTKEEEQCHFCQFRAFEIAKDGYKMAVTNDVDNERIDRGFRFIDKSVYGAGVEKSIAAAHFQAGCGCKADIDCAHDCDCLSDLDKDNIVNPDFKNAYYTAGPRKGLLREEILEVGVDEIYECSHLCSCSENCPNRVVGRGRQFDIEVFRTGDGRGWGVRAREDIRKGQFVDKYVGEILTPAEANRRRKKSKEKSAKDLYLFALDKFNSPDSADGRLRGEPYEVDGEFMSGPTRFINHSCDPNLRCMAVVSDRANKHLHDLCFFALEDITRLTELTFDYFAGTTGEEEDGMTIEQQARAKQEKGEITTKCLCGADNCRGWLW